MMIGLVQINCFGAFSTFLPLARYGQKDNVALGLVFSTEKRIRSNRKNKQL